MTTTTQDAYFAPAPSPVSARTIRALPAVSRVLGLASGLIATMPLLAVAGSTVLPTPPVLDQPDPANTRPWFVGNLVADYWLHGNAVAYVTALDPSTGLPAALAWLPAERTTLAQQGRRGPVTYWFDGVELLPEFVVHVKRGADPSNVHRGVGVIEEASPAWSRLADVETYARNALSGSGVPSVAIIAGQQELTQEGADAAKKAWMDRYSGPVRMPAIMPAGTEVKPLAWSPMDSELTAARTMSLTDVANLANMDSSWTGAPATGLTYKNVSSLYLHLVRQSLGPIMAQFEDVFSRRLVGPGVRVSFDRQAILGDEIGSTVEWSAAAVGAGLITVDEAREYLGKSPLGGEQA